jgi:4-alpha-glucanotransferase
MRGEPANIPPFPPEYRGSGLLLHLTSLPSPYGIGDLGPSAFTWVDRLHDAGQGWWQALPLGPTCYGNRVVDKIVRQIRATGMVIDGGADHCSIAGSPQPGSRKPCECARSRGWKLGLALHGERIIVGRASTVCGN